MTLRYSAFKLIASSTIFVMMGAFALLLAYILPVSSDFRLIRTLAAIFGVTAAQVIVAVAGAFFVAYGVAFLSLLSDGRKAAALNKRGVEVHTPFFKGLVQWRELASLNVRSVTYMEKTSHHIVIKRKRPANPLLNLIGAGDKLNVSFQMLSNEEEEVVDWLSAVGNRSERRELSDRPVTSGLRGQTFGK